MSQLLQAVTAAQVPKHPLREGVQVFDGHSGFDCADYAAQQLPQLLLQQPQLLRRPAQALVRSLQGCYVQLGAANSLPPRRCGCCGNHEATFLAKT